MTRKGLNASQVRTRLAPGGHDPRGTTPRPGEDYYEQPVRHGREHLIRHPADPGLLRLSRPPAVTSPWSRPWSRPAMLSFRGINHCESYYYRHISVVK